MADIYCIIPLFFVLIKRLEVVILSSSIITLLPRMKDQLDFENINNGDSESFHYANCSTLSLIKILIEKYQRLTSWHRKDR